MNKKFKFLCVVSLVLLVPLANVNASVLQMYDSETAVCTVVKRVSIDLTKPLTGSNPIEGLVALPTVCNGRAMSKLEFNDGMRSLMGLGWQVTSVSHQVTPLAGNATNGSTELLVSAVFGIERVGSRNIKNIR
jgi:hypothetical protein